MALEISSPIYSPLSPNSIRILTLEPGSQDSEIRCTRNEVQLHSKDGPTYEALSYVWGPPEPTSNILLSGHQHVVRANLFAALRRLRLEKEPRLLWVDALCINQSDIPERSSQVIIMSSVYKEAANVVAWLGEKPDNAEVARLFSSYRNEPWREEAKSGVTYQGERFKSGRRRISSGEEAVLEAIGSNPYWGRVWVIQEILFASSVTLLCGSSYLSLDHWPYKLHGGPVHRIIHEHYQRKSAASNSDADFPSIIDLCDRCRSDCEDRRDRIYGLLSLAGGTIAIIPDYSKSVLQLFLDLLLCYRGLSIGTLQKLLHPFSQTNLDIEYRLSPDDIMPAIRAQLQKFTVPEAKGMRICTSKVLVDYHSGLEPFSDESWPELNVKKTLETLRQQTGSHAVYAHRRVWEEQLYVSTDHLLEKPTFYDSADSRSAYRSNFSIEFISHDGTLGMAIGDDDLRTSKPRQGDIICHVEGNVDFHVIVREKGSGYAFVCLAILFDCRSEK
ncbi:hypothetical protein VTL71DRAFT_4358 [Oculimacula yallundae]|uniref:Heterokaryon incompatibility domain-containing protein n=1 Tax=Oculimacula yallundae TaxID=86028 RepID=A0ABR4C1S7_9HELO